MFRNKSDYSSVSSEDGMFLTGWLAIMGREGGAYWLFSDPIQVWSFPV